MNIQEILDQKKGSPILTISQDESLLKACTMLSEKNVGMLIVVEKDDTLIGVITERDLVRKGYLQKVDIEAAKVSELMVKDVKFGKVDDSLSQALAQFRESRFRHLPIKDENGKCVGVVTERDIIELIFSKTGN